MTFFDRLHLINMKMANIKTQINVNQKDIYQLLNNDFYPLVQLFLANIIIH
jgi:hypothetical protein